MAVVLDDLLRRDEDVDFEAKAAQGQDGQGELPQSFWQTYSAMANTNGGVVLLGARQERDGTITPLGLARLPRVRKALWDNLNNRKAISVNLLQDDDVQVVEHSGRRMLHVRIPRAARQQRPVYVGQNPLTGTYRRGYEGDYLCDEPTVRRMLGEASEDIRDSRILPGFGLDDIDQASLNAFRNEFRSTRPGHPWLGFDDQELLRNLGGWARNRHTNESGLTLAGLLMFGELRSILDAVPTYLVDYQERPPPGVTGLRWLDRVTTDGVWPGNLFEFYRQVYLRLIAELKVPFRLERGAKRVDESNVHEALREALVNTLIHADFNGTVGILIIKQPDRFIFRNPGGLRLPLDVVLAGGTSDCRNRSLQKMFQLIGAGEQAGSGVPKILRAWREQHWRFPLLREDLQPEQAVLVLSMTSLLPQEALEELDALFGDEFRMLGETERLAVATALIEGRVTNERLRQISGEHPQDLTSLFRGLVTRGFLNRLGMGRGTFYHIPGRAPDLPLGSLFDGASVAALDTFQRGAHEPESVSPPHSDASLPHNGGSPPHSDASSAHKDESHPRSEDIDRELDPLAEVAAAIRAKGRARPDHIEAVILDLCRGQFLTLQELARLLGRSARTLQQWYISRMVREERLELRFPERPSHPGQGYRTKESP